MKVDINNIGATAKSAVERQTLFDSTKIGNTVSCNLKDILNDVHDISTRLQDAVSQMSNSTEQMLGEEKDIIAINDELNLMKEQINGLLDTKEMDICQKLSDISMQLAILQNRTFSSQLRDEVKTKVNDVVSQSRKTIAMVADKVSKFFQNARKSINNVVEQLKTKASEISMAWDSYRSIIKTNREMMKDSAGLEFDRLDKSARQTREKKVDYILANRQAELARLIKEKEQVAGIEKLICKAAIINVESSIDEIKYINSQNKEKDKAFDRFTEARENIKQATDSITNKVTAAKDSIFEAVDYTKTEIKTAAEEARDSAVIKAINILENVVNRAKEMAEEKGIKLPTINKSETEKNDIEQETELE